jgi:hypothetical protein
MGLDAVVYCSYYERWRLRTQPPTAAVVDGSGALEATATDTEQLVRFHRWRRAACEHEGGVVIHRHLGNIAMVAFVREKLASAPERFSRIS